MTTTELPRVQLSDFDPPAPALPEPPKVRVSGVFYDDGQWTRLVHVGVGDYPVVQQVLADGCWIKATSWSDSYFGTRFKDAIWLPDADLAAARAESIVKSLNELANPASNAGKVFDFLVERNEARRQLEAVTAERDALTKKLDEATKHVSHLTNRCTELMNANMVRTISSSMANLESRLQNVTKDRDEWKAVAERRGKEADDATKYNAQLADTLKERDRELKALKAEHAKVAAELASVTKALHREQDAHRKFREVVTREAARLMELDADPTGPASVAQLGGKVDHEWTDGPPPGDGWWVVLLGYSCHGDRHYALRKIADGSTFDENGVPMKIHDCFKGYLAHRPATAAEIAEGKVIE